MKKALLFVLLLLSLNAFASLNIHHYNNVVQGTYKLVFGQGDVVCTDSITFSIEKNALVKVIEDECYTEGSATVDYNNSEIGPISLPQTYVKFQYGSDEQTEGWVLSLSARQDQGSEVVVTNLLFVANDGPNNWAFVEKVKNFTLLKQDKKGNFKQVPAL